MLGRRLSDGNLPEKPGDYSKIEIPVSMPDGGIERHIAWMMMSPDGGPVFFIGRPNPDGSPYHWVVENEDGTITVEHDPPDAPEDRRNSNSIKAPMYKGSEWHGYIDHGVWNKIE